MRIGLKISHIDFFPFTWQSGNIRKDPDCGSTKGCYSDCSNDNCNFLITWAEGTSADSIAITMTGVVGAETGRYVSIGLSDDDEMVSNWCSPGLFVWLHTSAKRKKFRNYLAFDPSVSSGPCVKDKIIKTNKQTKSRSLKVSPFGPGSHGMLAWKGENK